MMIENVRLLTRVEVEKQRKLNQFLQGCVPVPDVHLRALATIERMAAALKDMADTAGNCVCHKGFTSRKLRDPECRYHNFTPDVDVARALLREYEGGSDVG